MATERTAMLPDGTVVFLDTNKDAMTPFGVVVSEQNIAGFKPYWANNATVVQNMQGMS